MAKLEAEGSYRSEIALRTRRRALDDRLRKFTAGVFGLMGYSAVSNFFAALGAFNSAIMHPKTGLFSIAVGLLLGALYSLGAYRVWFKDDIRWWPVAIPACISLVLSILALALGKPAFIPLLLNVALLVMVPIRKRAAAAAAAVASKPISISASFAEGKNMTTLTLAKANVIVDRIAELLQSGRNLQPVALSEVGASSTLEAINALYLVTAKTFQQAALNPSRNNQEILKNFIQSADGTGMWIASCFRADAHPGQVPEIDGSLRHAETIGSFVEYLHSINPASNDYWSCVYSRIASNNSFKADGFAAA